MQFTATVFLAVAALAGNAMAAPSRTLPHQLLLKVVTIPLTHRQPLLLSPPVTSAASSPPSIPAASQSAHATDAALSTAGRTVPTALRKIQPAKAFASQRATTLVAVDRTRRSIAISEKIAWLTMEVSDAYTG